MFNDFARRDIPQNPKYAKEQEAFSGIMTESWWQQKTAVFDFQKTNLSHFCLHAVPIVKV